MNLQSFSLGGVTYRQQYRSCGRSCERCPNHGPYWYAIWWRNGRARTDYIGKELPPGVKVPSTRPAETVVVVPMLARTAARILGVSLSHPFDRVQPAYLRLTKEVRGRTDEARQKKDRIEEAWRVLCEYHGWM